TDGADDARDVGAVTAVDGLVVHRVAHARQDVVAVRPGGAADHAARVRPDVRGEAGGRVVEAAVNLGDTDRPWAGGQAPARRCLLVRTGDSGFAVHGLACVAVSPLQTERRVIGYSVLGLQIVGLRVDDVLSPLELRDRRNDRAVRDVQCRDLAGHLSLGRAAD